MPIHDTNTVIALILGGWSLLALAIVLLMRDWPTRGSVRALALAAVATVGSVTLLAGLIGGLYARHFAEVGIAGLLGLYIPIVCFTATAVHLTYIKETAD